MRYNKSVTHVILTGGVGSRLWPLSRRNRPKQYLDLFEGKSLFKMTVERNRKLSNKIIVVGNINNCHLSKEIMEQSSTQYIDIVEAIPKNTSAAIAFAAFASNPNDILMVTPSDHIINNELKYIEAVEAAILRADQGNLVTFGIIPTKAETGYGYIEFKEDDVVAFHEKPDLHTAVKFLNNDNFLWNSGMFCFKANVFLEELKKFEPEVYEQSKLVWKNNKNGVLDRETSMKIPSISVDYAVMERSKKIKVVPSFFDWSDLGSFESVYDYLIKAGHSMDKDGNIVLGTSIRSYFVGLRNCIFVYTEDAILILQKERSQEVKDIYQHVEKEEVNLL